jgi:hypothetical protein
VISSDFSSVYQLLAGIEGVDPLYCWVHMRRYFLRAAAAHPTQLGEWADGWTCRISVLYRAHRGLLGTPPGISDHQQALAHFHRAFDDLDAHRIQQTALTDAMHPSAAKVIATLNRQWPGLARHRELPFLPLDNNRAERALRTPLIGRKNFYGSGVQWPPGSPPTPGPSPPPPPTTTSNPSACSPTTCTPAPDRAATPQRPRPFPALDPRRPRPPPDRSPQPQPIAPPHSPRHHSRRGRRRHTRNPEHDRHGFTECLERRDKPAWRRR